MLRLLEAPINAYLDSAINKVIIVVLTPITSPLLVSSSFDFKENS